MRQREGIRFGVLLDSKGVSQGKLHLHRRQVRHLAASGACVCGIVAGANIRDEIDCRQNRQSIGEPGAERPLRVPGIHLAAPDAIEGQADSVDRRGGGSQ